MRNSAKATLNKYLNFAEGYVATRLSERPKGLNQRCPKDSTESARQYFAATVGSRTEGALQKAYLRESRVALDYLARHAELEMAAVD